MEVKRFDYLFDDYTIHRNGIIRSLHAPEQDDVSREELLEAFNKLTHSRWWNNTIKTCLTIAFLLIAYGLLLATNVPQP